MSNKILFLFLFFVLTLGMVSSVEISIKDSVKLQENFVIKVSGTFVRPLTENNIMFYRISDSGQEIKTSMGQYDLEKINGDYYFYLSIPEEKIPGNYVISLENIEYKIGNSVYDDDVKKTFSISQQKVPFSISPAFKVLEESEENYEIEVLNLLSQQIEIGLEEGEKTMQEIEEGDSIESGGFLDFLFELFSSTEENQTSNETTQQTETITYSDKLTLRSGESISLFYESPKEEGFKKVEFYYEDEVYGVLVYNPIDRTTTQEDNITQEDPTEENITEENITEENNTSDENYTFENETTNQNESTEDIEDSNETSTNETLNEDGVKACEAAGGEICKPNEEVCKEGDIKYSKGVKCCMSSCEKVEERGSNKLIGWGIIIAIAIFVAWFFKAKYRKAGPGKINLLDIGNKKD